ncbi:MAG: hypothetical protein HY769_09620, partial [Candidatus Stahlbacteria bacterium]|nr:hypothetical protein [Candidatus Stahlbacteria bacterium]
MKELTFREYISIIRKRKWWIISFVIIIPIAVLFITSRHRVLIYEAETTIKLTPGMPIAPSVGGKMTWWKMTFSTKTEAEVIKGTKIIEKAARVIGIISADMPTEEVARISKDLVGKIKTNAVENTGFITIKVRDSDAHFVAVFANELAKSYIEEHILEKNRESIKVRQFLEQQLAEKELALAVAEKEYKDYQEENADFFALASAYKSRMELIDQDISRLTEIYTPEHRKVKALQKEANKIRKKLKLLPQKEQEMSGMEEEIAADKVLYNKIKEELMEAKISESAAIEDVSIVNAAVIPLSPVNPSTRINIIIGIIAGLILGFIFVFVSESLDTSISTIGEIESYLSKKVLGVIPYIKANRAGGSTSKGVSNPDKSGPLLLNESTESALFEAWKMIAMNINFAIKTNPINSTNEVMYSSNPVLNETTLMLTSTVPNEGKTISSINLAITNAYSGKKTLLVDLDTKRPHLHRIFNTSREPGFIEFMMGRAKLNEVVKGISHLIV